MKRPTPSTWLPPNTARRPRRPPSSRTRGPRSCPTRSRFSSSVDRTDRDETTMKRPLCLLAMTLLACALSAQTPPITPEPLREEPKAVPTLKAEPFPLPGGQGGIGLDDLAFPPALRQVVVPAGRTGSI